MISVVRPPGDAAIIRGAPETPGCASHAKRWVLIATILGSSVAFLEATIINVALPAIQSAFATTLARMQWIASAYTLFLAALTLVGGAAGDRFGRRRLFLCGTAILAAASILCGAAATPWQLIVGRAIQGVGAALLVPNSLALLSGSFSKAERGRVIGIWSAWTALTGAAAPILGGYLVDTVSWRAGFLALVPFTLVTLLVTLGRVPEPPMRRRSPAVDWWGGALATIGLGAVIFAIIAFGSGSGGVGTAGVAAAVGIVSLIGFAAIESRAAEPMIRFAVFRSTPFRAANLLTLLLYFGVTAVFFVLPFNLVQIQGYSATLTGAAYLPFAIIVGALSPRVGVLADRVGAKPLLIAGPLVAAVGLALFALPSVGGSYWLTFFPAMVVVGLGMAITVTPLTATVMGAVRAEQGGMASAVNNTVARVGALLAVAVVGAISMPLFAHALAQRLEPLDLEPSLRRALIAERRAFADMSLPESVPSGERVRLVPVIGAAFVDSFRWVALISAACALTGTIGVIAMAGRIGDAEEDDAAATRCSHLGAISDAAPLGRGCEECLRRGDTWVHLRVCLSCGHVGCCDSSKNRHATAHFWASQHPIARSLEAGEDWRWCYVDETVV
jgi:EmrB/QacA subfamily drug resistance transporter